MTFSFLHECQISTADTTIISLLIQYVLPFISTSFVTFVHLSSGMLGIRFHAPGTYRSVDVWDASTNDDDEVLSPAVTSTESNADTADILERQAFILKLCKNMVRTGVQTHRIEGAMAITGRRLDIRGTYVVLPGLLLAHFRNQTHLVHCSRALDMHKLAQVNAVAHEVEHGVLALSEASCCLDTLAGSPPTWNVWLTLVGYAMTSATTSPPFFKGSWTDCWVSGLFGLGGTVR